MNYWDPQAQSCDLSSSSKSVRKYLKCEYLGKEELQTVMHGKHCSGTVKATMASFEPVKQCSRQWVLAGIHCANF